MNRRDRIGCPRSSFPGRAADLPIVDRVSLEYHPAPGEISTGRARANVRIWGYYRFTLIRDYLAEKFAAIVGDRFPGQPGLPEIEIAEPRQPEHGDFACNFALAASKALGANPRDIATAIASDFESDPACASVEVAGPGFINIRLRPEFVAKHIGIILDQGTGYAHPRQASPQKINVEFVSVNPNGPITIGSGRGAAFGSALCNVLEAAGHTVHREYYINDGINSEQMRLFAESVRAITEGKAVPVNGYKGDYVHDVADQLRGSEVTDYQRASEQIMLRRQREALTSFGVEFDTWFSEQSLHDGGAVALELDHLTTIGSADNSPHRTKVVFGKNGEVKEVIREDQPVDEYDAAGSQPTIWLRSTKFGDDMDRVLRRRDGRLTYIASDVAYHKDKFNRPANADRLITILGPDHHGYIGRLTAVVAAMLLDQVTPLPNEIPLSESEARLYSSVEERNRCQAAVAEAKKRLLVHIYQLVRFLKDGKPAPMRKRDGNIYALIDLVNEIGDKVKPAATTEEKQAAGRDVARFFYLMRHHDTTFDFDLDLAERQSDENPVFYVQYAHARIASVIDRARDAGFSGGEPDLSLLTDDREKALIIKLCDLPNEIARTSQDYAVNRLATYAVELARSYHAFYDSCRVIEPSAPDLSNSRVALCKATQIGLQAVLGLLGVSAPERMERNQLEEVSSP